MTPEEQIQTASARLRADRETANQSRQVLVGIINDVCDAGMSEVAAARHANVTRLTIRSWRGKGRR
jgi:hypothetical protein